MQCTRSFDGSNGDPHFVRCVQWETPPPLPPLCPAVGQQARSERVASTLNPSAGPAATIKCWHALGVHSRQGFVRAERGGTVAHRANCRLECAPRVRSRPQLDSGALSTRQGSYSNKGCEEPTRSAAKAT